MEYVEILRARRVLFWYGASLLGLLLIIVLSMTTAKGGVHGESGGTPLSTLLLVSALGAWIVATCVSPGLNAEAATIPIAWTRPMPRDAVAWRFVAVDVGAIIIGYGVLFAYIVASFAMFGLLGHVRVNPEWLV